MNKEWKIKKLENCLEKVANTNKIKKRDFLSEGVYPIISQEKDYINGYWNNEQDLFRITRPIVIFGDHTKVLKFIDFDFVMGADGVKILQPSEELDPRFFYYYLQSVELKDLGYARHYRLLKEINVPIPPIQEQHKIVKRLDKIFEAYDEAVKNVENNLLNVKELFESELHQIFTDLRINWKEKRLEEVCKEIFAGGDVPKDNLSMEKTEEYPIPIYANAVKNQGLYGFTNSARVTEPCITISARGSGTGHTEIRYESFLPIVRLIVLIPISSLVILEFLKYAIDNLVILKSGSAIPQLTIPMIREYSISLPPINEQTEIIEKLSALYTEVINLEEIYQAKLANLDELRKSFLQKAVNGEL